MAEVGYRAIRVWVVRSAMGVVLAPVSLLVLGGGVMLLTADSVAGVLGFLLCLSLVLFIGLVWFVGTRVQFLVDDEGLTIVHYVRTHRIPWEQVAVIEQSSSYWTTGAAVVVLREPAGRRITALATTDRMMLYRGENPFAFVDASRAYAPRPPTQAAIAAHRRWIAATNARRQGR
ncbi:PH domain-containing protein [Brachybacterium sp. GU-2]|uniref:PH domain-containing protein n=1 Tax=Brachybacterium sp. GU-2 TaxID=3069708 RepID=UPI00280AF060|nr:PH domain-containing protein [Brachybacterium sp. GU-2]WME23358.1 PH domain-containing protein [Brachybacterium sp. GU-2]